jgi:hypothetical protein
MYGLMYGVAILPRTEPTTTREPRDSMAKCVSALLPTLAAPVTLVWSEWSKTSAGISVNLP